MIDSALPIKTFLHSLGPVTENDSLPSTKTAGGLRHVVSEEAFIEARKILDTLVVDSKIIPVIGGYVAAATDIGSILLELASVRLADLCQSLRMLTYYLRRWTGTKGWQ